MADHYENLEVSRDGAVSRLRLTSTSKFNALNARAIDELLDAVTAATTDDGVRCVVLAGNGSVFSAGADLAELSGDGSDRAQLRSLATVLHDAISVLHRATVPVIAGVEGVAAGAGFGLAMCADLVVMSEDARFEYVYPRVGLTGDGGSTWFLPRLVGLRRAREIALLDEEIDPDRALDLGLVTETVPPAAFEERLDELAAEVARGPTRAYGATKRLFAESFDRGLEAQMAAESDAIADATTTDDYERGYAAFFGDGSPEFRGE